eukprot:TRINITY_DN1836_c0_g1_i1.p2 TRINITY_DN1836_c0_g1~~TRINITY_DN1836_c0_g1_i1.p2  ORF type:complete len:123 (-),score=34.06 TRINITY_DN1836_c0_g1_i1:58-399(-)
MQAVAPRDVYSVIVYNNTGANLELKVTYQKPGGKAWDVEWAESRIPTGSRHPFGEKQFEKDGCKYAFVITKLEATNPTGLTASVDAPFNVHSPTKDHPITFTLEGGQLKFTQG